MFNEQIVMQKAPAVFASAASDALSKQYNFLRTADVIEAFEETGWVPVYASQVGIEEHSRHLVRMRQLEDVVLDRRDLCPELVITNAHNGLSSLKLNVGLYRKICSNGLVVRIDAGSEVVRHAGKANTMEAVLERGVWVVKQANDAIKTAKQWSRLKLDEKQQNVFAKRISKELTLDAKSFTAEDLFRPQYDEPQNLWTCFNMAQERAMRGGLMNQITGRRTHGTQNVIAQVNRNAKLWDIAAGMVEVLS